MDAPPHGGQSVQDDAQSFMDEDDVREYRLHHWLTETAVSVRLLQDVRADSPVLGFDHTLHLDSNKVRSLFLFYYYSFLSSPPSSLCRTCRRPCLVSVQPPLQQPLLLLTLR
jgi:hypothetical protein